VPLARVDSKLQQTEPVKDLLLDVSVIKQYELHTRKVDHGKIKHCGRLKQFKAFEKSKCS